MLETAGSAPAIGPRRVVTLRPTSPPRPAVAPSWAACPSRDAARRAPSDLPEWAEQHREGTGDAVPGDSTGGWVPEPPRDNSASALAESVFPFGAELPYEPDAEAAAFLNAPRRPLGFYVAPFGTPPFGNPPTAVDRSVYGGPLGAGSGDEDGRGRPQWGSAYPAGA